MEGVDAVRDVDTRRASNQRDEAANSDRQRMGGNVKYEEDEERPKQQRDEQG